MAGLFRLHEPSRFRIRRVLTGVSSPDGSGGTPLMRLTERARQNWILAVVTILPRVLLCVRALLNHMDERQSTVIYDGYLWISQSLVRHGVFAYDGVHSISTRAPLMPLLWLPGVVTGMPVYWLFLLQIALTVFAVLNIRYTAVTFGASNRAAFILALFVSLNPWLIFLTRYGSTAIVACFLISCVLRSLAGRKYALLGLCGGVLVLCHPSCALALPGALISDGIRNGWRTILKGAVVSLTVCLLVLTPWIVRNYVLTGRFVATIDGFGYQYLLGSSAIKYGRPYPKSLKPLLPPGHDEALFATVDSTANSKMDRIAKQEIADTILHHPGAFVYRCAKQFGWFWIGDREHKTRLGYLAHFLYVLPLLIGAIVAIFTRWKSSGSIILISLPTILIHTVVVSLSAEGMYLMPILPVLAVMTATVVEKLAGAMPIRRRSKTAPGEPIALTASPGI